MDTIRKQLYTTSVTSTGGREGRVSSDDGVIDLELHAPKELGGPGGATNPEQLFAAGYAACFHSALVLVASREGIDTSDSSVRGSVRFGTDEHGGYVLAVNLAAALPGVDADTVQRLVQRAHEVCPYSRATRGNIEVTVGAA
jgi:Ohr subfamily peroxiredoxin